MATGIATLPDEALAGVFSGLPLRSLAVARCVCKAWHDIIDARALLLPHHLPHSVRGVFINYVDHDRPHHFARPCPSSTIPIVDGMLSFLPNDHNRDWWSVMDHCNGLLLCDIERGRELCMCNPATSRWTLLPRPPGTGFRYCDYVGAYIAFDPMESPHFQVVLVPAVPKAPSPKDRQKKEKERRAQNWEEEKNAPFCLDWFFSMTDDGTVIGDEEEAEAYQGEKFQRLPSSIDEDLDRDIDPWRLMEWPPTPWTLHMFTSRDGQWEERAFVRQGMPAGIVEKMRLDPEEPTFRGPRRRYAVYHNGSLYVHCRGSFVTRLSLSNSEYQIIEVPIKVKYAKPYLGKLKKDVCFGIVHHDHRELKIWTLNDSYGQMEWVLKHEVDIGYYAHYVASQIPYHNGRKTEGSWTVEEYNTDSDSEEDKTSIQESYEWDSEENRTSIQESYEWDSDNDDTFTVNHLEGQEYYYEGFDIIGFHPFKDVVFMAEPFGVVAYHLNDSKIQYLGNSRPKCYYRNYSNGIYESFPYTPCMIGDLLYGEETGQSSSHEDY